VVVVVVEEMWVVVVVVVRDYSAHIYVGEDGPEQDRRR
jgi:hypothetical protein